MKNIKNHLLLVGLVIMPLMHAQQPEDTWWDRTKTFCKKYYVEMTVAAAVVTMGVAWYVWLYRPAQLHAGGAREANQGQGSGHRGSTVQTFYFGRDSESPISAAQAAGNALADEAAREQDAPAARRRRNTWAAADKKLYDADRSFLEQLLSSERSRSHSIAECLK